MSTENTHEHIDKIEKTALSKGENLVGDMVEAMIEYRVCTICGNHSTRKAK